MGCEQTDIYLCIVLVEHNILVGMKWIYFYLLDRNHIFFILFYFIEEV